MKKFGVVALIWFISAVIWLGRTICYYGRVSAFETGVTVSIGLLSCFMCGWFLGMTCEK